MHVGPSQKQTERNATDQNTGSNVLIAAQSGRAQGPSLSSRAGCRPRRETALDPRSTEGRPRATLYHAHRCGWVKGGLAPRSCIPSTFSETRVPAQSCALSLSRLPWLNIADRAAERQHTLISRSPGAWTSEVRARAESMSGAGPLPGPQIPASLCVPAWRNSSSVRALIPHDLVT